MGDDGIMATPGDAVKFLKGLMEGKLLGAGVLRQMQTMGELLRIALSTRMSKPVCMTLSLYLTRDGNNGIYTRPSFGSFSGPEDVRHNPVVKRINLLATILGSIILHHGNQCQSNNNGNGFFHSV